MAVETGRPRAPYASDPGTSRGRAYPEPPSPFRTDFRRDCDRIIHSAAFRRLKYKTQVFVFHEGDHYRTRLTHTLEVMQIARALARALGLDEDLAEALALVHDLGHPPFGHAGERQLDECLRAYGGFDHNAQTLRVAMRIERRYPEFDGLNLTWETLEGIVKHNGPLTDAAGEPVGRYAERGISSEIAAYSGRQGIDLATFPAAEAQIAALADDIAYDAHDLDDGVRADLFGIEDVAQITELAEILGAIDRRFPHLDAAHRIHELIRRLIARMIEDVIAESSRRFAAASPRSADEVRAAGRPMIAFSRAAAELDRSIKQFLLPRMYQHERILRVMRAAQAVVADLFAHYLAHPDAMPSEWQREIESLDEGGRARHVADFIAGMTDRYALIEHARHFDSTPELV